jgi:hypothetical protein
MKNYRLEFKSHQTYTYRGNIMANSPEEAIRLYREDPDDRQSDMEEESLDESWDDLDTTVCIGVTVDDGNNSSHLEMFNEPVKLES